MKKRGVKIRKEPGVITHLPSQKIDEIRIAAKAAIRCLNAKDKTNYEAIIDHTNASLTKYEKGIFTGFALSEVQNA